MKEIKAILFDLDNTLIDFWKMKKAACKAAIEAMIKAGLKADKRKAWTLLNKLFNEYGIENQKIFDIFLERLTGTVDVKLLAAGVVAYRKVKELYIKPYANVASTLGLLKKRGLKLAIITDAPRFQAWSRLFGLKLENYFDFVIALEDTGQKKPSHLPFKVALRKLRMKPKEVIMVGDSIERDVIGAKKLGMVTVLAKYGQIEKEKGKADYEINDISNINEILKKNNPELISIVNKYKEEDVETKKLIEYCKPARKRGFLTQEEFIKICKWKSPRPLKYYINNSEENIKNITQKAFSTKFEKRKIEILIKLNGVCVRVASSILAIIYPEMYGVLDFHVRNSLENFNIIKKKSMNYDVKDWYRYIMIIRHFAKKFNVTPRDIDRALWNYDKEKNKN